MEHFEMIPLTFDFQLQEPTGACMDALLEDQLLLTPPSLSPSLFFIALP